MPDIKGHQRAGDEAQDETSSAPFQSNPDRVYEQDDQHGHGDDGNDEGMGSETFHEVSSVNGSPEVAQVLFRKSRSDDPTESTWQ
jgi:hypothetical protein